jgi:pyridoxine 4-dehydrogenase
MARRKPVAADAAGSRARTGKKNVSASTRGRGPTRLMMVASRSSFERNLAAARRVKPVSVPLKLSQVSTPNLSARVHAGLARRNVIAQEPFAVRHLAPVVPPQARERALDRLMSLRSWTLCTRVRRARIGSEWPDVRGPSGGGPGTPVPWSRWNRSRIRTLAVDTLVLGGDLPLRRVGYGAMRITGSGYWGEPNDPKAARRVLRRAAELGVNFIDTADTYGPETSERLIAEALHPYGEGVVIATKGGQRRSGPYHFHPAGRPESLRQACDGSLRRLRLERIDLYQLHAVDPNVPFDESVGALAELRAAGKIRHVGLCNVDLDQLRRARSIVPIASVQNRYNLADRASEPVVEACESERLVFIPWLPLGRGDLAVRRSGLTRIAAVRGATPAQVALAWLLHSSRVTLPIPGTTSLRHLEENVAALELKLSDEELAELAAYELTGVGALRRRVRDELRPIIVPLASRLARHKAEGAP